MKAQLALGLIAALLIVLPACVQAEPPEAPPRMLSTSASAWRFDDAQPPRLPMGWSIGETRPEGIPATWELVALKDAPSRPNAFAVVRSANSGSTFNLATANGAVYGDFELSVRVKAVNGVEDQGGGPVWRYIDSDNYYVCRWNPLESNFRIYKVIQGKRIQLKSAKTNVDDGAWVHIGVTMKGERISCSLDGEILLDLTDDTLTAPGLVGLWTKADAETAFDDLIVTPSR